MHLLIILAVVLGLPVFGLGCAVTGVIFAPFLKTWIRKEVAAALAEIIAKTGVTPGPAPAPKPAAPKAQVKRARPAPTTTLKSTPAA